ncbi:helix-turn-helix domain-containing protein, partial [Arthrobacter sp. H20]
MVYLARALELRDGDKGALEALTRGKASTATVALRARTVLLAADGVPNFQIEKMTGFSAPTVLKWRNRYAEGGIEALSDVQRPGREREIDEL